MQKSDSKQSFLGCSLAMKKAHIVMQYFLERGSSSPLSSELQWKVYNGCIYACYWPFTLEFVMEMYTKWGENNTMDFDGLGMKSEQQVRTELIETALTKDILSDGIWEIGKRRDGSLRLKKDFFLSNSVLDNDHNDYHNQFLLCTCINKCIQHRNRSVSCLHNISPVLQCTDIQFH